MLEDKKVTIVPRVIENTLENLIEPTSKSVGNTFSDIWYLIFGGYLGFTAEKKK